MNKPLLIVVHPGALCGSADMHLGQQIAQGVRSGIAREIHGWDGDIAVITGELEDELVNAGELNQAVRRASFSVCGSPFGDALHLAASKAVKHFGLKKGEKILVTGAWNDLDGTGCVTFVSEYLLKRGFEASISKYSPASDVPTPATSGRPNSKSDFRPLAFVLNNLD